MTKKRLALISILVIILTSMMTAMVYAYDMPWGVHGPGKGYYRTDAGYWRGDVWVHFDENGGNWDPQGVKEVGIEGLNPEGGTAWYSMNLVYDIKVKKNKMTVTGDFGDDWPLQGCSFTYEANFKSMRWRLHGDGFNFQGTIADLFWEMPPYP